MFKYFSKCVFCFSDLPEEPTGEGEHVIPQNIYGFWHIYDVCDSCKQYFGDHVDQLSIKDPQILNALKQLELPDFEKYSKNLPFIGKDSIGGYSVDMVRKNKSFKNKVRQDADRFFECSEDDWKIIGKNWIRKSSDKKINTEDIERELANLEQKYDKSNPGETVESELLNIKIRKRQVKGVKLATDKLPSITPLIAKIAVIFLCYSMPARILASISDMNMLVRHARYNENTRDYFINWCPIWKKQEYVKMHVIRAFAVGYNLIVDVSLFGFPSWRIILNSDDAVTFEPTDDFEYDAVKLILDFREDKKELVVGYKIKGENSYEYYSA